MIKILLPPLGTKIEPAGGIFLSSLESLKEYFKNIEIFFGATNRTLTWSGERLDFLFPQLPRSAWGSIFFNVVMYLCEKMRSGNQNISRESTVPVF